MGIAFFGDGSSAPVVRTAIIWNSDGEPDHSFPLKVVIGAESDCFEVDFPGTWPSDARLRISLVRGRGSIVCATLALVDRTPNVVGGFQDRVKELSCHELHA